MSILDEVIVGTSKSINLIRETIELVSETDATVVISGEPGTGRNLVATTVYQLSTKYKQGFMRFDCAANRDSDQLERENYSVTYQEPFPKRTKPKEGF